MRNIEIVIAIKLLNIPQFKRGDQNNGKIRILKRINANSLCNFLFVVTDFFNEFYISVLRITMAGWLKNGKNNQSPL